MQGATDKKYLIFPFGEGYKNLSGREDSRQGSILKGGGGGYLWIYAKFIYYPFCSINWDLHNESSDVPSLSAKIISDIVVKIPDIKEQQAIAGILSDMDNEIEAL